jgi:hypothetical protein
LGVYRIVVSDFLDPTRLEIGLRSSSGSLAKSLLFALAAGPEVAMTVHPLQVVTCSGDDC